MKKLRDRLTYANVISTICLFLLLGGGAAFAATQLPKNSVGAKQLKKHAVTPAKLAKSTVNQLQGAKGPQGPAGATGPKGDAGPAGKDAGPAYIATGEGAPFPPGEHGVMDLVRLKGLPAGSYKLTLTAEAFNGNTAGSVVAECILEASGASTKDFPAEAGIYSLPPQTGKFATPVPFTQQSVVTFNGDGGELNEKCFVLEGKVEKGSENEGLAAVVIPKLVATKVASTSIQEEPSSSPDSAVLRRLGVG